MKGSKYCDAFDWKLIKKLAKIAKCSEYTIIRNIYRLLSIMDKSVRDKIIEGDKESSDNEGTVYICV